MANKKWLADARQLLIEIERIYNDYYSKSYDQSVHDIFNAMRRIVRRNATFRTVEVVHGRCVYVRDEELIDHWECSVCGRYIPWEYHRDWNYCPNCGANMDGDGNG
jgi:rubrerythrin